MPGLRVFAAVMAGLGLALASSRMSGGQLETGELIRLPPDYPLEPAEVHAVFSGGPRMRAFLDYLAQALRVVTALG